MSSEGSVTCWLEQLKAGDRTAVQKLWEGYFPRLVNLARAKLRHAPRRAADEEDIALSALKSFCRAAEENRFPQLQDRDDLWQLLVVITARKAINLVEHEQTQKEGGGKVRNLSALTDGDSGIAGPAFADMVSREPDPAFAFQMAEEYRHLLAKLGNEQLQSVAVWKMEGYTNEEIAAKLDGAVITVERRLRMIRTLWDRETKT
jgi:DNA-directed RNA polymerase specialized sigma24 family protein